MDRDDERGHPEPAAAEPGIGEGERYQLIEPLDPGGPGVVWRARDRVLDRDVALKFLEPHPGGAAADARIAAEARTMARLAHPGVVAIYDVGHSDGKIFMTMELVDGVPLSRWLSTPRSWREVVAVIRAAGEALAAAHAAGVVHGGLDAGNILIGRDGRVQVADFGVTSAASPAGAGDAAGDQRALTALLDQALRGRPSRGQRAPLPATVPRWLTAVIERGLAADPGARQPSMAALVAALGRRRRVRGVWIAGGLAAVAAVGALVVATGDRAAPCAGIERHLDGVWDIAIQRRIATAATDAGIPDAAATATVIERELGRYAEGWATARRAVCRAAHATPAVDGSLLAGRNACLDLRLRALALLAGALASPDRTKFGAVAGAVGALPPVDDCAAVAGSPAVTGAVSGAAAAREDLALAIAQLGAGTPVDAGASAGRAARAARSAGDHELEAEGLIVLGRSLSVDQPTAATLVLLAAATVAAGVDSRELRVDAWGYLASSQLRISAFPAAAANLERAEATLAAGDRVRAARLALTRCALHGQRSDYAEATGHCLRALSLQESLYGEDSVVLLRIHRNLALDYRRLGQWDQAERHGRRGLQLAMPLGAHHREVARAHVVLGTILEARGQDRAGAAELEAGIAGLRAYVGDGTDLATAETNLGNLLYVRGDRAQALGHYREALAIGERIGEPMRTRLHIRHNIALVAMEQDPVAAEVELRELLALQQKLTGPEHADAGRSHQALGQALAAQGRAAEALAELATAQRILEARVGPDSEDVAEVVADRSAVLRRGRRFAAALELDTEARRIRDQALPDGHRMRLWSAVDVAHDQLELGQVATAVATAATVAAAATGAGFADVAAVARWLEGRAAERGAERGGDRAAARAALARIASEAAAACLPGAPSTDVPWRRTLVCADLERWRGAPR